MSVQTLYTAATGMTALQMKLDTVANNLANVETVAYKRGRTSFEDLLYHHEKMPGTQDSSGQYTAVGISVGMGTRVSGVQSDYTQGAVEQTGRPLDVSIEGPGFFQIRDPSGATYYSRAGNFSINAEGSLVLGSAHTGRLLEPQISIPSDTTQIAISPQGIVSVKQPGNNQMTDVGQIELAQFVNPEGLLRMGENLYAETDASGTATLGQPGQDGLGTLQQNSLESSNVEPVQELIDLIKTQRAFEMNSQTVQAGDQMMQTVANLRRY